MSELRHRIELAIIGRTAPRAAEAVMAVLAEQERVSVPLAALRALVEQARSHAQSVADEWGMGDADDPANVEMRELVEALEVEGL